MWWILGLGALWAFSRSRVPVTANGSTSATATSTNAGNQPWRESAPVASGVSGGGTGVTDPMTAFWMKIFGRDWRLDQPNVISYGTTASTPMRGGTPASPSGEYEYVTGAPSSPGDWRNPLTATPPMLALDDPSLLYEPMPWYESAEGEFLYVPDVMI